MQHTISTRELNQTAVPPVVPEFSGDATCEKQHQEIPATANDEEVIIIDGREFLRIENVDRMPPFLMSVVSDSDVWLFVGSNGGFTAGRVDPDHAFFPYQTADRILKQPKTSGVLSLITVDGIDWEPWTAGCPLPGITRNLYKHVTGTSVIFEERHEALALSFRWELTASERFGLVRTCRLENLAKRRRDIRLLDGWNHLLPHGVSQETYARYSYLAAAYMRHEAVPECRLGIYTLNSGITDRAEPSESLRVTCAWSLGLDSATLLLSDRQLDAYRRGETVCDESEVRGFFGGYLLATEISLEAMKSRDWSVVADTGLDHSTVTQLRDRLRQPASLAPEVAADLSAGVIALKRRIAGAGAIQQSADTRTSVHHFANVLFNCMRGGTLHDNYRFPREDFQVFLKSRNKNILARHQDWVDSLPDPCTLAKLASHAAGAGDAQLARIAGEYLPLCFSRRHGDPSRPWNRFEIHTKDSEGRPLFAYAGNWRDIFQNWESLAYSYPDCFEPMIAIFLNASTADGYNPYRITRTGIDWEVFDASDPWSHIGYWGDHQIIYLLRLLEGEERFHPGRLSSCLHKRSHAYAHVPYEIRSFDELLADPKHSIHFNEDLHRNLTQRAGVLGGDGKLLTDSQGEIILVSLAEKLLLPLLVKLSNLVPGGGIWLNTQRPEWNDANNALAGWGLSVVTVCYLRRYLAFLALLFDERADEAFELSVPVAKLLAELSAILPQATNLPDDSARFRIIEALGRASETQRKAIYAGQVTTFTKVGIPAVREFITVALAVVDATLSANRRDEHLFHSYNLLEIRGGQATIHNLDLMLEGQVAALSSGILKPFEALGLLAAMRTSQLYRKDQNSYLLYPDRTIAPFLKRNTLPTDWKEKIPRMAESVLAGHCELIRIDSHGLAHFHPDLTNARDLNARLDQLGCDRTDRTGVQDLWEAVFHHRSFTGRSGAMFAFEGLGSIYWHMVAKLLLAAQEVHYQAAKADLESVDTKRLAESYYEIRNGLGFTKDARSYGAFPTDPYSHSPQHIGAQQPGMTGQVKEEVLTRMGELGVSVENGQISFRPVLLKPQEFIQTEHTFRYIDLHGECRDLILGPKTLAFTAFQVPVCYELAGYEEILLTMDTGDVRRYSGNTLPKEESRRLFARDSSIASIIVKIRPTSLFRKTHP